MQVTGVYLCLTAKAELQERKRLVFQLLQLDLDLGVDYLHYGEMSP